MDCNYVTMRTRSTFPLHNGFDSYPIGICINGVQPECIKDTNTSKWTVELRVSPQGDSLCYPEEMVNNQTLAKSMMGPQTSTMEDLECDQSNPCDSVWFLDYTWEPKTPDPKPDKKWTVNGLWERTNVGEAKSQKITCSKKDRSIHLVMRWNEDQFLIEYFRFEWPISIIQILSLHEYDWQYDLSLSDTECQSLIQTKKLEPKYHSGIIYYRRKRKKPPKYVTGFNTNFGSCPGEFYNEMWFPFWVYAIILLTIFLLCVAVHQCVTRWRASRARAQALHQGQGQQQMPQIGQQRVAVEGIEGVPNAMNGQAHPNYNAYNNPNAQVIYVPRQWVRISLFSLGAVLMKSRWILIA